MQKTRPKKNKRRKTRCAPIALKIIFSMYQILRIKLSEAHTIKINQLYEKRSAQEKKQDNKHAEVHR
jgi:hypothetical protein